MITIQQTRGREIEEIKPELVPVRGQMIIDTAERNFKVGDGETELLTLPWWLHKPPKIADGGVVEYSGDGRYEHVHLNGRSYFLTDYNISLSSSYDAEFSIDKPDADIEMPVFGNSVSKYGVRCPNVKATVKLPDTVNLELRYAIDAGDNYNSREESYVFTLSNFKFGDKVTINTSLSTENSYTYNNIKVSHNGYEQSIERKIPLTSSSSDQLSYVSNKMYIGHGYNVNTGLGYFYGNIYFIRFKRKLPSNNSYTIYSEMRPEKRDGVVGMYDSIKNVFTPFSGSGAVLGGYIYN